MVGVLRGSFESWAGSEVNLVPSKRNLPYYCRAIPDLLTFNFSRPSSRRFLPSEACKDWKIRIAEAISDKLSFPLRPLLVLSKPDANLHGIMQAQQAYSTKSRLITEPSAILPVYSGRRCGVHHLVVISTGLGTEVCCIASSGRQDCTLHWLFINGAEAAGSAVHVGRYRHLEEDIAGSVYVWFSIAETKGRVSRGFL